MTSEWLPDMRHKLQIDEMAENVRYAVIDTRNYDLKEHMHFKLTDVKGIELFRALAEKKYKRRERAQDYMRSYRR